MMNTAELIDLCKKELRICMLCKLTNEAMLELRSTTKVEWVVETIEVEEEEQQLAEAKDRSLATDVASKDTMQEIVTNLSQYVLIVNPMNTLLKTAPFYREGFRKRDHNWVTKMSS